MRRDRYGHRANFVLVDHDGWQLFYSHWAGCRMLDALIAGPELAVRYILNLEQVDWWTDELWADGGAVLDLTTRTLKFFGDELMAGLAERRAVMRVLPLTWPDFTIEFLYDGANALATHVGVDPAKVRFRPSKKIMLPLERQSKPARPAHLVTVVGFDGRIKVWTLRPYGSTAWYGPRLPGQLPVPCRRPVALGALPDSGVHVDVRHRRVGVWMTIVEPGLLAALPDLWPGWQIECWGDGYETHLARCKDVVTAPDLDLAAGLNEVESWLQKRIFESFEDSPAGQVMKIATMLSPLAPGLEVSPCAVENRSRQPTTAEWAVVKRAFAQVRSELSVQERAG